MCETRKEELLGQRKGVMDRRRWQLNRKPPQTAGRGAICWRLWFDGR